jgi:transcriptional regulator
MPGPPVLREDDLPVLHGAMRAVRLKDFVSTTVVRPVATPLPFILTPEEGPSDTLRSHPARVDPRWRVAPTSDRVSGSSMQPEDRS